MMTREKYELIGKIIDRADEMGIVVDKRFAHMMDLEFAVKEFDIDLEAWLNADNFNFMHDWVGIYRNIDREVINATHSGKDAFNYFVPRFARR